MAKLTKPLLPEGTFLPVATNDEDKPVPVEVKMVLWVKRSAWLEEHGAEPHEEYGYDFDDVIGDWARAEVREAFVEQGEWSNVTEVTE